MWSLTEYVTLKPFLGGRQTMAGTMLSSRALEVCCHCWTAEDTWYFNEADVMNLSLASRSGLFPLLPNKAHPAYEEDYVGEQKEP